MKLSVRSLYIRSVDRGVLGEKAVTTRMSPIEHPNLAVSGIANASKKTTSQPINGLMNREANLRNSLSIVIYVIIVDFVDELGEQVHISVPVTMRRAFAIIGEN